MLYHVDRSRKHYRGHNNYFLDKGIFIRVK
jgi:hypothetical protein